MHDPVFPLLHDEDVQIIDPVQNQMNVYASPGSDLDTIDIFAVRSCLSVGSFQFGQKSLQVLTDLFDRLARSLFVCQRRPVIPFSEIAFDQVSYCLLLVVKVLSFYIIRSPLLRIYIRIRWRTETSRYPTSIP